MVTSFATDVDDEVVADAGAFYTEYMTITDESGLIEVSVPVEWVDVNGMSEVTRHAPRAVLIANTCSNRNDATTRGEA